MFTKVFWPLTCDIVCEDNSKEGYAHESGKNDEIDVAVSG